MTAHYLGLFVRAVFVENMALAFFLGMCTFLAVSKKVSTAFGLGLTVDVNASVAVTRVELWDGSTLMGARVTKDPAGARTLHADFDWTAVSPGAHLLAARAVAADGTPSWSRSIPVTVGLSTLSATGGAVAVPAEAGQTAADTAEHLGVDPASLIVPGPGGGTTAAESPDAPVGRPGTDQP